MTNTNWITLVFQQLPQVKEDDCSGEIIASGFEFFVYFFDHVPNSAKDANLDFTLTNNKLSGRVFDRGIRYMYYKNRSFVQKSITLCC